MTLKRTPTAPILLLGALLLAGFPANGQTGSTQTPDAPATAEPAPERVSRLQGKLSLDRRSKVIGVTVLVGPQDDDSLYYLTASGDRGAFRVDGLPDGDYEIQLSREGYTPVRKKDVNLRFPFRSVVEITMERALTAAFPTAAPGGQPTKPAPVNLAGTVTDWDGKPLSGIRLRLVRPDGMEDPRFFRTGPEGSYRIPSIRGGTWRLEVQGVGFLPLRQQLDLAKDTTLAVIMVPQPSGYLPSPLDLMPSEQVLPPADWDVPPPRREELEQAGALDETAQVDELD